MIVLKNWLRHMRPSALLLQWIGNALIFAMVATWLQIPDSHAWQFALSMAVGAGIVIAFCWLQVKTFSLKSRTGSRDALPLRVLGFVGLIVLWCLVESWIGSATTHVALHATYWNSKMSPSLRVIFTPARLATWAIYEIWLAEWLAAGFTLPLLIQVSVSGFRCDAMARATGAWRSVLYWAAVVVACFTASWLTSALLDWTPGKSVAGQITSVTVRMLILYSCDIVIWWLLIGLTASRMEPEPTATANAVAA